jgi:protoporphyrinogen oxidase
VFNNWSEYLVKDPQTVWLGLEYFANEGDELWQKSDEAFMQFAKDEMVKIGLIDMQDVLDSTVVDTLLVIPV